VVKTLKRTLKILLLAALACALFACSTFERLLSDIDGTFINPQPAAPAAPVVVLDNTPRETAAPAVSPARFSAWNRPGGGRDVSAYRTAAPLPAAAALARSRPASSIKTSQDMQNLVQSLLAVSDDRFLQVKALHDWVALTLVYDAAAYFSNALPDQAWPAVLSRGKAVCEGYANVLDELLRLARFQAVKANGYARGAGNDNTRPEDPRASNHAWNLVRIFDHWYLIDATWDSGHLDGRVAKPKYSTDYFLIQPEWLIYTHFPARPEWQLIDPPLSAAQFSRLPDLRGSFFRAVQSGYQTLGLNLALDAPAVMELELHPGYQLSAGLYQANGGRPEEAVFAQRSGTACSVYLAPPPGRYLLRLYAAPIGVGSFASIAEFVIESTNRQSMAIPVLYGDFGVHNARIIAPLLQALRQSADASFELYVENIVAAFLYVNGQEYPMNKSGTNLYSLALKLPRTTKVDVFVQKSSASTRRSGLLSWPVLP